MILPTSAKSSQVSMLPPLDHLALSGLPLRLLVGCKIHVSLELGLCIDAVQVGTVLSKGDRQRGACHIDCTPTYQDAPAVWPFESG